jgi:hypothetical protein
MERKREREPLENEVNFITYSRAGLIKGEVLTSVESGKTSHHILSEWNPVLFWLWTYRGITQSLSSMSVPVRRGADKSLAAHICSTTKRNFLGWVKEVRTTKS